MIVVMRRDAKKQDIEHMIKQVESLGLKPTVLRGTERTVIAAIGDERNAPVGILESGPGVDEVLPVLAPYKLASIETKSEPTVVRAGSLTVGGGTFGVIAGPCSVESEEQIVSSARAIKKAGATALRGGAFKPRTSPYSFQGLKEEGLKLLATARDETGLAVVTEVVAGEDVDARLPNTPTSFKSAPATCRTTACSKPSANRTARAAQARPQRHDRRAAARRRIHPRRRQPASDALRTRHPHVRSPHPLHAAAGDGALPAGRRRTCRSSSTPATAPATRRSCPRMARAAIAAGADGLIVEVHPNPEKALSDGYQSMTFKQFEDMMAGCRKVAAAMDMKM